MGVQLLKLRQMLARIESKLEEYLAYLDEALQRVFPHVSASRVSLLQEKHAARGRGIRAWSSGLGRGA